MAKARALDKRRKSVRNIRKITRTMELIATARFKRAMDRAHAATAYTQQITQLVADLSRAGLDVSHPLLERRSECRRSLLLVLSANRGLCGGYNSNVQKLALRQYRSIQEQCPDVRLEVSGKRGAGYFKFRQIPPAEVFTHFEDRPTYDEVDVLATRYLEMYISGQIDRLDVVYTRFNTPASQDAIVETLLPLESLITPDSGAEAGGLQTQYEFVPSAEAMLEELVPTSFKVKLFKCFLDAAVSEQIARRTAMKAATENADSLIKMLSMTYNRARQGQITSELLDVLGGVEALKD